MFYVAWYTAPSGKWILEMRLVSGHFGDGVWSRIKRQKREEEQLAMGFVDNCTPPPLRPGERRRVDETCDCRPTP